MASKQDTHPTRMELTKTEEEAGLQQAART